MDVRKIPVAGLQLLLLLHATHSFVLLTANIEDVKKLAMKFVSESLAEKIAGFLSQAAQQMISQVSEEVNRDVSEENKEYNIKQESSEKEYAKDRRIRTKTKKDIKNEDYRKDDVFSLIASDKYTAEKKPPLQYAYTLNQHGKHFKTKEKDKLHKLKYSTPARKSNGLSEVPSSEKNDQLAEDMDCSSAALSLEDNTINDDENKTEESALQISFRSEDKAPNEATQKGKLIATSGHLKFTKIITDRPSDDEKSENESGNEKKEEKKEKKIDETWF